MRSAFALIALVLVATTTACGDKRTQAELVSEGRGRYESRCAACHGMDLQGTDGGPPFLNPIYAPNHHPDSSFFSAVRNGVQPHHWNFGAMPKQTGYSDADIEAIIAYIRSQQVKAGITNDPTHE